MSSGPENQHFIWEQKEKNVWKFRASTQGFFQQFLEKAPVQNWEKMID